MAFINGKPHLNIEVNKDMDLWTAKEFLTFDDDDMFSNTILELTPSLKEAHNLDDDKKEEFYKDYIDKVYKENNDLIRKMEPHAQTRGTT